MAHPPIVIMGYSEAAMSLRQPEAQRVEAIVSIHGRHELPIEAGAGIQKLTLQFDDVDVIDPADPLARYRAWVRQKWAAEVGRPLTAPTVDDAQAIIDFARTISEIDGIVLFQCQAGISRSPAAALVGLAVWTGPGREGYCVEQLQQVRQSAVPLRDLVVLGDRVLDRHGELVRAVQHAPL